MVEPRTVVSEPCVLVVEGKDDLLFFEALIKAAGLSGIQVLDIGGKTRLRDRLDALATSPGFALVRRLGIVRDANTHPQAAFQSVCDAVAKVGLSVPRRPLEMAGEEPQVAVIIIPDANAPGMLEDLCLRSVSADPAMACLDRYLHCLEEAGCALGTHPAKARLQAFLASRPEPDKRLGEAAQAGYWPWESDAFRPLIAFLGQLAGR